ncbi:ABC transporter permease [Pantoea sp. S18]|uniref:ABC transporter permease n=1 Tax=Pantoea sp. S18 TaxID=3019892 RepID=UPI002B1EB6F8|nr:ABC transporter permease [Pantoea sp. S18]MEA5104868.1 ABC transporter permease [Pantoea sp. S18]
MARSGIQVQASTVKALFFRELRTRFGKFRLGYLWAIIEPAAHLLVLLSIFSFIMHRTMRDISFPVFLLNGIILYLIFSSIVNRSIGAIDANKGLFNYRPVKPIDTVLSRAFLESVIYLTVYVLLMGCIWAAGENFVLLNMLQLALSWGLMILFSCSIGIIVMTIGSIFTETHKILPILLKPLYFISGVMFPLQSIPEKYWPFLLWNPILHAVELSREAIIPGYVSVGVSLDYLAIATLCTIFIGLTIYRTREEAMLTS